MAIGGDEQRQWPPRLALAFAMLGPVLAAAVNVWTRIHDRPELADASRLWEPLVWEISSAGVTLALLPLIWRAVLIFDDMTLGARAAAARAIGFALAFSLLHVGGFVLFRFAAYASVGSRYEFGGARSWLYELPKDLVTFVIIAGILLGGRRLAAPLSFDTAEPARSEPLRIKDGSRTFLIMPEDVLAANASGNYVEYHLSDGRRPLSRSRFGEAELMLEPLGFIRTHRSWMANRAHVREIRAVGNGDHELVVGSDLKVPVSRRFAAEVLASMR